PGAVGRAVSSISWTKVSRLVPVAASDFATDSVEGQRARPSGVMRFDLLKVVGSSPAFLARPEGERPARCASRSRAVQTWRWVSMASLSCAGYPGWLRDSRPPLGTLALQTA